MGGGSRRLIRGQAISAINSIVNALPVGGNKIGKVSHSNTGIGDGRKEVDVAGTAETLVASSIPCTKVNIMAEKNSDKTAKSSDAKVTVNESRCKRCGICTAFCPTGVFVEDEFGLPLVKYPVVKEIFNILAAWQAPPCEA